MTLFLIILGYLIFISIVAVILTIYDKKIAKKNEHAAHPTMRVPERTLMMIAAVGGSVAMLITMKKIHHKTKHRKFMWGIPAIIAVQVLLIVALAVYFVFIAPTV